MSSRSLPALLVALLALSAQASTFTVTNADRSGAGSLADAMTRANDVPNSTIVFNLAGTPPFTIDVAAPLPVMTVPVRIDATTQPGYAGKTPVVTLVSHLAAPVLDLRPPTLFDTAVFGLAFRLDQGPGIVVMTGGASISSCVFERGGAPSEAETASIRFVNARNSGVGSSSFSFGTGIEIVNSQTMTIFGSTFDGHYGSAIALKGSSDITIGQLSGKVSIGHGIAAGQPAISIDSASSSTQISYTEIAGAAAGIDVAGTGTFIRQVRIHDVDAWAIRVNGGQATRIEQVSIYNVGAAAANGIVLANGGDSDVPAPTLTSAAVTPQGTTVRGFENATAKYSTTVWLYASDSCSVPVGQRGLYGQSGGSSGFTITMPPIKPGSYVTALEERSLTASGVPVETSSFSQCIVATGSADGPAPAISSIEFPTGVPGSSLTIHGSNFATFGRVLFGTTEASCQLGSTAINCTAPEGSGTVDVIVENPDGKRAVKSAGYTYLPACDSLWINSTSGNAVTNGEPVVLSVVASSAAPLSYAWYADNALIAGETHSSLSLPAPRFPTLIKVRVTNACGGAQEAVMSVSPCNFGGVIQLTQPLTDASAVAGTPATFCVQYSGVVAGFQWYEGPKGNTTHPLPNGNSQCVKVTAGQTASLWARLTNECGSVDSNAAALTALRRRAVQK